MEALVALVDPGGVFRTASAELEGDTYHGHEGIRAYFRDMDAAVVSQHVEPEAFFDLGDATLAFVVGRGRGAQSGAEVSMRVAWVVRWRDDRCTHLTVYANREDALRDLGVSEDGLEPIGP